ncbi:MAG: hypothetical protein HY914_11390 [Desulfomonile tiedjei]|nr:hypothetical protein [Desulfomonile tiedjei]
MTSGHSVRPPARYLPLLSMIRAILVLLLIATVLPLIFVPPEARGQKAPASKARPQEQAPVIPEAPNTTIGDSGFNVPIPEIKMKRIIRDRPAAQPATPGKPESEGVGDQEPEDEPAIDWLPFDPARRRPVIVEPPETQPEHGRGPKEEAPSVFKPPVAPEDYLVAPSPRTELLKAERSMEIPQILAAERLKDAKTSVPLRSQFVENPPSSEAEIALSSRWEPRVIPPPVQPEPEPDRVATTEAAPMTPPKQESATEPAPTQAPLPEPERVAKAEPPSIREPEEAPVPAPLLESPQPPPVEEAIASPLAKEAPSSPELREYLRSAAPILEELSLLMTRAPTLAIADYDPSDVNAAIFPEDIYLKLDAMKRELQILDAKTFSIIPPKEYALFHSTIRDSIAETYQACDTIMRYMRHPTDQELHKIQGHLGKVRHLIRKTRTGRG